MFTLPKTELLVHPLCLGANVFGWSADEPQSFAVLDAYVAAGGNFIDTADVKEIAAEGTWGGSLELHAAAQAYTCRILVVGSDHRAPSGVAAYSFLDQRRTRLHHRA